MSTLTHMEATRHVRKAPPKRSPHRSGRITSNNVLDNDPRGFTLCGAEPTSDDLGNRSARSKSGRQWITCPACAEELDR